MRIQRNALFSLNVISSHWVTVYITSSHGCISRSSLSYLHPSLKLQLSNYKMHTNYYEIYIYTHTNICVYTYMFRFQVVQNCHAPLGYNRALLIEILSKYYFKNPLHSLSWAICILFVLISVAVVPIELGKWS